MTVLKVVPDVRVKPDSAYLLQFAKNVTSQFGEDGIIEKIFEIIGTTNKWCVEFGAWDGKKYSNTWRLLNEAGWSGVLVEGNEERFGELQRTYAGRDDVKLVNRLVDLEANTLDSILSAAGCPREPDLVSIDVDGMDWHIWNSLVAHRPRLAVIEFNPTIPNDVVFVQPPNPTGNHGNSLRALVELGKEKGYELVCATTMNGFFVLKEELPKLNIADNDINALYDDQAYQTKLFQLYDGTLVICGLTRLLWKGWPITSEDIQVVPRALRKFEG